MVKYYLYRLDWSRDNVRVSEKYRFVFEDLANIWIYTNSRKINSEYEKVSIKESIIPYNVKEWILECEIILSKEPGTCLNSS